MSSETGRRKRRISIYVLLSLLILVLSAPMLLLFGRFVMDSAAERRTEAINRGLSAADQVADALDREFQSLSTMLAVFASSGWIEDQEYQRLYLRAKTALAGTDTYLVVLDQNLDQILNTRVPFGQTLGQTPDPATARQALKSRRTVISNLFQDQLAHTSAFNMALATASDGTRARVLILTRNAQALTNVIDPDLLPAGWSYAIFDDRGQMVARSHGPEADRSPPSSCASRGIQPPGQDQSDSSTFAAVQSLVGSPWSVCVWASYNTLEAPVSDSWRIFSVAVLLVVIAALIAAALLGRIIVGGTTRAARVGRQLEKGEAIDEQSSYIAEIDDVLQVLRDAARERSAKEEELRLLLGETAHRAKNQLAIAGSLVRLAAGSASDVTQLRDDLTTRFVALSRSVDMLVGRNWQRASLPQLVRGQLKPFIDRQPDRLQIDGEDVAIAPTAAQSLGLVMNELATNASKYGAWSNGEGCVAVQWGTEGGVLSLTWTERGGPPAAEPSRTGFGTQLIDSLIVRSFSGEVSRSYEAAGLTGTFRVPLQAIQTSPRQA